MGSETYHEPYEELSEETRHMHRAIVSLMEELEAIDWYQQRADATRDDALRDILIHNKNEEIEHAMMTLEWIRRKSPEFDEEMRKYLFSEGPILEAEQELTGNGHLPGASVAAAPLGPEDASENDHEAHQEADEEDTGDGSLRIGRLR